MATLIFGLSAILALAVFGYGFYLKSSIASMTTALEQGRALLEPEKVDELIRLDNRLNSTGELIKNHLLLTPLFKFLESSTIKNVRFTEFNYAATVNGLELSMRGEARSYAALAQQAELLNKSGYLKDISFSDLTLDEKGNVVFFFRAFADQNMFSYLKTTETGTLTPVKIATSTPVSAASSSPATSTPLR
ncbi:MAG: hypothetical protein AAB695_00710 [Patescibacteria group bacterium]